VPRQDRFLRGVPGNREQEPHPISPSRANRHHLQGGPTFVDRVPSCAIRISSPDVDRVMPLLQRDVSSMRVCFTPGMKRGRRPSRRRPAHNRSTLRRPRLRITLVVECGLVRDMSETARRTGAGSRGLVAGEVARTISTSFDRWRNRHSLRRPQQKSTPSGRLCLEHVGSREGGPRRTRRRSPQGRGGAAARLAL